MTGGIGLLGIPVGMVGILLLGFAFTRLAGVRNGVVVIRQPDAAKRVTAAVAVAVAAAIAVGTTLDAASGGTDFSLSGEQRYLTAPVVYGIFVLVVLTTLPRLAPSWPVWVPLLLLSVTLSLLVSPLAADRFTLGSLLQGVVLLGGAAVFALGGLLRSDWQPFRQVWLLRVLLMIGVACGLLGLQTGVFSALVLPSAVAVVFLLRDRPRGWPLWCALGVVVIVLDRVRELGAIDQSAASTGQLLLAVAIFGLALLPRRARLVAVVVVLFLGLVVALQSEVPGLLIGRGTDLADVTLAERAYETQEAFRVASASPLTLIFGGGPGATLDLTDAPDSATLLASGRDLTAVPTVHLLTSYLVLKLGLLGLGWLGAFCIAALVTAVRVLSAPRPVYFDLVLLAFVITGIVQALPAATFLFSNPLPTLCLAILHVRRTGQEEPDPLRPRRLTLAIPRRIG